MSFKHFFLWISLISSLGLLFIIMVEPPILIHVFSHIFSSLSFFFCLFLGDMLYFIFHIYFTIYFRFSYYIFNFQAFFHVSQICFKYIKYAYLSMSLEIIYCLFFSENVNFRFLSSSLPFFLPPVLTLFLLPHFILFFLIRDTTVHNNAFIVLFIIIMKAFMSQMLSILQSQDL